MNPTTALRSLVNMAPAKLVLFLALANPAHAVATAPAITFTEPKQFLAGRQADVVALVDVEQVATRWIVLAEDGDHVPLLLVRFRVEEILSGKSDWKVGDRRDVVQFDYSDLMMKPIAPPAIPGRRYLLWASSSKGESDISPVAPWIALPDGLLLLRTAKGSAEPFVFWAGLNYSLPSLRAALQRGGPLPLDEIADPVLRIKIAQQRLHEHEIGEEKRFIHGLLLNVIDPDGQAKRVEHAESGRPANLMAAIAGGGEGPHYLWFESLTLLSQLGEDPLHKAAVIAALTPLASDTRPKVRLAVALTLAELGSDAGRAGLVDGYEHDSGEVSKDPPDLMTFPGRFRFDNSSTTACAYALALLGDRRGLGHAKPEVRLAAATALADHPDEPLRTALREVAKGLEPKVAEAEAKGELTKARAPGDYTTRYPSQWIQAESLLARTGDEGALRRLVEAYLVDAKTYPDEPAPLVVGPRPVTWSGGTSLAAGLRDADAHEDHLLTRLRALYAKDERWSQPPFQQLRASLGDAPASAKATPPEVSSPEIEKQIRARLADRRPERRAEGWAAAGQHQVPSLFERTLDTALHGRGIEKNAAIYGLGFYQREIPEQALRELVTTGDLETRFTSLELATRTEPARFAREALDLTREFVRAPAATAGAGYDSNAKDLAYMPRILCRLARGPIPQSLLSALNDKDPRMRVVAVESLLLAGNPQAAGPLEGLKGDADASVRKAAEAALNALGPGE